MSDISKRQPGRQLSEWFDWFDAGWPSWGELWRGATHPIRIEDKLENDRYVLRAELPGIDPEKDVDVTVENGVLSVSAERQERSAEKGRSEFRYGSFRRRVTLPQGAQENAVEASYRDGILEITVPISTSGSASRSIRVSRQDSSAGEAGGSSVEVSSSEPTGGASAEPSMPSSESGLDASEPSAGASSQPGGSAEMSAGAWSQSPGGSGGSFPPESAQPESTQQEGSTEPGAS